MHHLVGHELPITEWEYLPHIGPRPSKGFVGLKNAGATCYMNSVLQQLYMISPIRDRVMQVEELANDLIWQSEEDERREKERETNRKNKEEVSKNGRDKILQGSPQSPLCLQFFPLCL